jgi:hypothetical protein
MQLLVIEWKAWITCHRWQITVPVLGTRESRISIGWRDMAIASCGSRGSTRDLYKRQ